MLALTLKPDGSTAKEIGSFLTLPKSDVNKALYRLEKSGRTKVNPGDGSGAPKWTAAAGAAAAAAAVAAGGGGGGGGGGSAVVAAAAVPAAAAGGAGGDAAVDGQVCALSRTRRCTVSDYRGKKYVGLREYYEKDGKWLPGKKVGLYKLPLSLKAAGFNPCTLQQCDILASKFAFKCNLYRYNMGISLAREQWSALKEKIGDINEKVAAAEAAGKEAEDVVVCELAAMRRAGLRTVN
jgi:hypothetical protein